ncbi:MAG: MBL fold metallo-hydrolase [Dehalococcoidia bacterium]
MCIDEIDSAARVSRRRFLGLSTAVGLAATGAALAPNLVLPGLAHGAHAAPAGGGPATAGVNFRWFGVAGWEISFGSKTILIDPWLTRTVTGALLGRPVDNTVQTTPNEALLDQHFQKADIILISHGHYDHTPDIPFIAQRTGARVFGSETHMNLMRALGVPEAKLSTVRGGENMEFDGFSIEVFPSLHGLSAAKQFVVPHHLITVPAKPTTPADFSEGDTLDYQLTVADRYRIFMMGTANYIERALTGLQPDVALIALANYRQTHQYLPRLLRVLNYPSLVMPTHWDNWEKPLDQPAQDLRDILGPDGNLDLFVQEVQQLSPQSQVTVLDYLQSYAP